MPDVHLLTADEMHEIAPYLDTTGLVAGSYTPRDGHVMPMDGLVALAAAARKQGARIEQHWPVQRLEPAVSGGWRAFGPRGVIIAQRVVVVAGALAAGTCCCRSASTSTSPNTCITAS